jgi:hypothetical protein
VLRQKGGGLKEARKISETGRREIQRRQINRCLASDIMSKYDTKPQGGDGLNDELDSLLEDALLEIFLLEAVARRAGK